MTVMKPAVVADPDIQTTIELMATSNSEALIPNRGSSAKAMDEPRASLPFGIGLQ